MITAMDMAMRRAIHPDTKRGSLRVGPAQANSWLKILAIMMLCVVGIGLSFSIGIAAVVRDRNPALALRLWPWDARTRVVQADNLLLNNPGQREFATAKVMAQQSLARDPTSAPALRVLGFVQENSGNVAGARAMIRASERLSRRDLAGQLWLINDAVARDQAEEALGHFDTALRTSELAAPMLLPVLANATEDPRLIAPLAATLAKRPPWGPSFIAEAIHRGPAPQNLILLDKALRVRGVPMSQPLVQQLVTQLVARTRFADALTIYGRATEQRNGELLIRDQGFEREPRFAPFDWMIGSNDNVSVYRSNEGSESHGYRLTFDAPSESYGDVARQMLVLPPGKYRASFDAGVKGADVRLSVSCATYSRTSLVQSVPTREALSVTFAVPAKDCDAQWIAVTLPPVKNLDGATGWIDNVTIEPEVAQ